MTARTNAAAMDEMSAARGYDSGRAAAVETLRRVLPGPVIAAVLLELRTMQSLVLLARRRRHGVGPRDVAIPYARGLRGLLLVLTFGAVAELVVLDLIVPWPAVRAFLLVFGLYGLLWVAGYLAAVTVRPHVLAAADGELRLRHGQFAEVIVPLAVIAGVQSRWQAEDGRGFVITDGEILSIPTGGSTSVEVHLDPVCALPVRRGRTEWRGLRTVRLYADDPQAAVTAIRAAAEHARRAGILH